MVKINYTIATYSGIKKNQKYSEYVLQLQLRCLYYILIEKQNKSIDNYLKQITIVCPPCKNESFKNYYQKEKWVKLFDNIKDTNLVYLEYIGENKYYSYDQWLQSYKKYPNFDYYIMIEDDYCVLSDNLLFDIHLVNIYKHILHENIGYLCSWSKSDIELFYPYHAAISNGIISRESFEKIGNPLEIFYNMKDNFIDNKGQIKFSIMFTDNNIPLVDYTNYYNSPYWCTEQQKTLVFDECNKCENSIFVPTQSLEIEDILKII